MESGGEGRVGVAHLIHTMAYGGVETSLINWLTRLPRHRYDCSLICFANPGETERPFVQAAQAEGLSVSRIPWNRAKPVLRSARALETILRERRIKILHCHNTYADLVGLLAAKRCGIQCVTTLYVWGEFGFKRAVLQGVDRLLLRFFDRVTAHCESTRSQITRTGFREREVPLLICGFEPKPAGFSPEERAHRRSQQGISPDQTVLVNVARFWPEKAHEVLLEAMRVIRARRPETVLWLLGVGPEEERIRSLATSWGLEEAVRFLGFRSDLEEILALTDIMVHPSDMEGVPLAVLSGMAAGLPVVATHVGGLPEIIRDGQSGVLIPPRQPAVLADAVLRLMDDGERRQRLGRAALHFLETQYSLDAAAARVAALYAEMTAGMEAGA